MKKLIAVLTLMFAFAIGANAQDKKMSAEESAKMNASALNQYVGLQGTQEADLHRLFIMNQKVMLDETMSVERKKEMARVTELKIRATLKADQMEKLDANPELLARLTGSAQVNSAVAPATKK